MLRTESGFVRSKFFGRKHEKRTCKYPRVRERSSKRKTHRACKVKQLGTMAVIDGPLLAYFAFW